jgi:aldehyde dehydrogenase (NAD+)
MGQTSEIAGVASPTGSPFPSAGASAALEVRDPADRRCVVAEVPAMEGSEVAAAYEQARAGFGTWRHANPLDRAAVLARLLRRALSGRNVRLQTETGGKNASVVLADADLDLAADTVAAAAFGQAGQRCTATSRLIADSAVAPALLESLRRRANACVLGPGLDPATTLGPLATPEHRDSVLAHVDQARAEGAEIIAGGSRPAGDALQHGCYVEPAIVSVNPRQSLWREEVFGPVVAVCPASGFDEAVELANDSRYGLSAAVFTSSLRLANEFIDRAEAGQVSVNLPTSGWDVHHPFGGFRDSGSSFKEQGAPGLRFYTRLKTAAVRFAW